MSDILTSQLVEASFRGVPFRIRSESQTEGGRKIVLHDYVNSSERFVEDLGEIPPKFRMTAFVHGSNFISLAERLQSALNEEGTGRLFLPTFGSVEVYALPYTKDASQQEVGEIIFELEFAVGRPAPGPSASDVDVQQVFQLGDNARQKIQEALSFIFEIPGVLENSSVAQFDINTSMDSILENYKEIIPSENLSNIQEKIFRIKSALPNLIRDPQALSENLIGGFPIDAGLWQELSLGLTGGLGFDQLVQSTTFGSGNVLNLSDVRGDSVDNNPIDSGDSTIPLWLETTAQRISRNNNRLNVINSQRVSALVGIYETVADTSYNTQDQINSVRVQIENVHERIMRDETIDENIIQSNDDVRKAVEDVRIASLNVLEQKEQEAFIVTDSILNSPSSSFIQAYNFYAEEFTNDIDLSDRAILLRNLNPELPATALNSEINIFRTM